MIIYYALYCKPITKNGVLDAVLATPLQGIFLFIILSAFIAIRIIGYKGTTGIKKKCAKSKIESLCDNSLSGYIYLPLYKFKSNDIVLDCSDIGNLTPLHKYIEVMLRFTVIDKNDLYRLEAGSLDIPKATLESVVNDNGNIIIKLGSCSFYNIFYTHYFADYHLSSERFDENSNDNDITLRYIFGESAEKYICTNVSNFNINGRMLPYPLFPNPLGVTGICRVNIDGHSFIIQRQRHRDVINEVKTIDLTFSGLVEAHTMIRAESLHLNIIEYYLNELKDEFMSGIGIVNKEIVTNEKVLGIIFNEKYLYQPEIIILITISIDQESKNNLKSNTEYPLLEEEFAISTEHFKEIDENLHKYKDLYKPSLELFKKYVNSMQDTI